MQYYYLEHECSLCFVKWYSILLILVSWLCFAFKINLKKKKKQTNKQLGHPCKSIRGLSNVQIGYDITNEVSVFPK